MSGERYSPSDCLLSRPAYAGIAVDLTYDGQRLCQTDGNDFIALACGVTVIQHSCLRREYPCMCRSATGIRVQALHITCDASERPMRACASVWDVAAHWASASTLATPRLRSAAEQKLDSIRYFATQEVVRTGAAITLAYARFEPAGELTDEDPTVDRLRCDGSTARRCGTFSTLSAFTRCLHRRSTSFECAACCESGNGSCGVKAYSWRRL